MAQRRTTPTNPTSPPSPSLLGEWYEHWERSMAGWWDRVLDAPEVLGALNQTLAGQVRARGTVHQAGQKWMERLNMPSRDDLVRIMRIATLLEEKLLGLEDRVLEVGDHSAATEKEAMRARIDAAEARIDLSERLLALESRLTAIEHKLDRALPAPEETR